MITKDTMNFLVDLSLNNNREWFDINRQRYEDEVREPAFALIRALEPELHAVSPHFTAIPKKTGGSLMRVFRDTRFAADKTPYKTNVGIQFRHEAGKDVHAPGFYLHLSLDGCFVAAGMWGPDSKALRAIRDAIDQRSEAYLAARDDAAFREVFSFGSHGDSLKTAPRGFAKDHPLVEDLRLKHHIATRDVEPEWFFGEEGVRNVAASMRSASAYVRFLTESVELPF